MIPEWADSRQERRSVAPQRTPMGRSGTPCRAGYRSTEPRGDGVRPFAGAGDSAFGGRDLGPCPRKSVSFCSILCRFVCGGWDSWEQFRALLAHKWTPNGRFWNKMERAFGRCWRRLGGVYLLFRSRTYNSTGVRGDQGRSCACGGLGAEWGATVTRKSVRGIPEWLLGLTSRYEG